MQSIRAWWRAREASACVPGAGTYRRRNSCLLRTLCFCLPLYRHLLPITLSLERHTASQNDGGAKAATLLSGACLTGIKLCSAPRALRRRHLG